MFTIVGILVVVAVSLSIAFITEGHKIDLIVNKQKEVSILNSSKTVILDSTISN